MSTSSTLKLALELAAKVTGREELAALAGQVQELGPLSDETAAETAHLATTLENLTQQRDLIAQFEASGRALSQLEQATVLSRDRLTELRREQQGAAGSARQLTDQERLLASEVKQLERQLVAQSASHSRLHASLTQAGLDTGLILPGALLAVDGWKGYNRGVRVSAELQNKAMTVRQTLSVERFV